MGCASRVARDVCRVSSKLSSVLPRAFFILLLSAAVERISADPKSTGPEVLGVSPSFVPREVVATLLSNPRAIVGRPNPTINPVVSPATAPGRALGTYCPPPMSNASLISSTAKVPAAVVAVPKTRAPSTPKATGAPNAVAAANPAPPPNAAKGATAKPSAVSSAKAPRAPASLTPAIF